MSRVASRLPSGSNRSNCEDGRVTAFVMTMTAGILALAGLTLDGGLALATKVEAIGQAQEAARAGAQQIDLAAYRADGTLRLNPHQATEAAHVYLAATGRPGHVTATATRITVTVTANRPTQLLSLVGISSLTVEGTGSALPQGGIAGVEP